MVDSWLFNEEILDFFGDFINDDLFNNFFYNFFGDFFSDFFSNYFDNFFGDVFFESFDEFSLRFSDFILKVNSCGLLGFGSNCIGGKK